MSSYEAAGFQKILKTFEEKYYKVLYFAETSRYVSGQTSRRWYGSFWLQKFSCNRNLFKNIEARGSSIRIAASESQYFCQNNKSKSIYSHNYEYEEKMVIKMAEHAQNNSVKFIIFTKI